MGKSRYFISQELIDRLIRFYSDSLRQCIITVNSERSSEDRVYCDVYDKANRKSPMSLRIVFSPEMDAEHKPTGRIEATFIVDSLYVLCDKIDASLKDDYVVITARSLPGLSMLEQDGTYQLRYPAGEIEKLNNRVQELRNNIEQTKQRYEDDIKQLTEEKNYLLKKLGEMSEKPKRRPGAETRFTEEDVERIRKMKADGVSIKQIAINEHAARGTIYAVLKDGYKPKTVQ